MRKSNNILSALERIDKALGGRDDDANNVVEAIDQIADALQKGGGGSSVESTATGFTEDYYVYRSTNHTLGLTEVTIS